MKLSREKLDAALNMLSRQLHVAGSPPVHLVICGGSALIATGLRSRTTTDVDVVALLNECGELVSPDPLPGFLLEAADVVRAHLGLRNKWLNNEASSGAGGLFQFGLPMGFASRLVPTPYGAKLTAYFIGRIDQIHFKLFPAADETDPVHLADLRELNPTDDELESAACWAMTHDVSEGFKQVLRQLLKELGNEPVARRI